MLPHTTTLVGDYNLDRGEYCLMKQVLSAYVHNKIRTLVT